MMFVAWQGKGGVCCMMLHVAVWCCVVLRDCVCVGHTCEMGCVCCVRLREAA